jgi:hypothetical protein
MLSAERLSLRVRLGKLTPAHTLLPSRAPAPTGAIALRRDIFRAAICAEGAALRMARYKLQAAQMPVQSNSL